MTSSYHSDAVGQPIALAWSKAGMSGWARPSYIPMQDRTIAAKITGMVFVDPENTRLKI